MAATAADAAADAIRKWIVAIWFSYGSYFLAADAAAVARTIAAANKAST